MYAWAYANDLNFLWKLLKRVNEMCIKNITLDLILSTISSKVLIKTQLKLCKHVNMDSTDRFCAYNVKIFPGIANFYANKSDSIIDNSF